MSPLNRPVVRRMFTLLAVLPLIVLCAGCADFWVSDSSIQSVTVSPTALILRADATPASTFTFHATSQTVGGTTTTDPTGATWSSSNTSVATAGSGGVITAANGASGNQTATITATVGGQSGTARVLTYTGTAPSASTDLKLDVATATPAVGVTVQATATADINNNSAFPITSYVSWTSSPSSVCTITTAGVVSTLTAGTCTVTASARFSDVSSAITNTVTLTVGGI